MNVLDPLDPLSTALREQIGGAIEQFVVSQHHLLGDIGAEARMVGAMAQSLAAGGKRMRPAFAIWGAVAAGDVPAHPLPLIRAAASIDLLHTGILVHDDVMDASATRRGLPAAHRQFAARHLELGLLGDPVAFGAANAMLLGDLLQLWSVEMLDGAGLAPESLGAGRAALARMRTEVTLGQVLDVTLQHEPITDSQHTLLAAARVVDYKTTKYTVQRPAQFGALLAGGDEPLLGALEAYGSALGRAFQFRDDLLGVFGDETLTGKPAGDDLREGKRTVLVAHAYARTTATGRRLIDAHLGDTNLDDAGVATLRGVIVDSGAPDIVENMIIEGFDGALAALDAPMTDAGRQALERLAYAATQRES